MTKLTASEQVIIGVYDSWLVHNAPTRPTEDDAYFEEQARQHIIDHFGIDGERANEIIAKRGE